MMADGKIKIAIEVDGKQVEIATKDLKNLENAGHKSGKGVKETEQGLKGVGKESERASGKIKKFATALGLVAVGAAAFATLKGSMDAAIRRFDTLNKFPKVLQALGVSAEESEKAMQKLSDGIDGLPTTLDDIASTAQRMYTSFNDIGKATDTALALNNALLGSGSSAQDAQRGAEQYMQALQRGKFEMEEWKTLQETMDIGLIKIAESFGYTGKSAKQDLYNALKDGIITMDQFNDKLIEVGTGTGVMAQLAKENSLGIATSLSNLRNAFARGMANIIDSMNRLSKEATGKDIAQNIDSLKGIVNAAFKAMGNIIEATAPILKAFISVLDATLPIFKALAPAIIGAVVAYQGLLIVNKVKAAIEASNRALDIARASQTALTLATNAQIKAQMTATGVKKADAVATIAQTGAIKLNTMAINVLTGKMKLAEAATIALAAAKKLLSGPVGWVTAGVGALAGAVVGLVKWFKRETEEAKRLKAETEKLAEATDGLADSVNDSTKAYKDNQKDIKTTAKANKELVKRIEELSKKENKTAADKLLLSKYVDQLNESIEGLNLSYDENADSLNMSTEELGARVDLMKEEASLTAAQKRLLEIEKERTEVEMQLEEINKLRDEWNQKLEEGSVKSKEHKVAIAELDEQEAALKETLAGLAVQQAETEEQITESTNAITEAVKSGVSSQILDYEKLKDHQIEAIVSMKSTWQEYQEAATDMFDTLSDKSELTVKDMTKNLEENQRIISEWADNIAKLAERGVDEGLLDKLREAGPQSAGHVKALVNASDEELQKLNEIFKKGGETATKALAKALGIDETGVMDAVEHLVANTEVSLREQVKAANFPDVGKAVADGYGVGIKEGTADVEEVVKDMADITTETVKKELGIQSPSTVFKEIGGEITEGMALGVTNGTSKVIEKMQSLLTSTLDEFKDIYTKFSKIGSNAMSGLNQGLLSGESQVMSTARRIANNVASTMKNALEIHSPSRITKDIGRFTGMGLVLGLESMRDRILDASKSLAIASIPEHPNLKPASPMVKSNEETKKKAEKIMAIFYKIAGV